MSSAAMLDVDETDDLCSLDHHLFKKQQLHFKDMHKIADGKLHAEKAKARLYFI